MLTKRFVPLALSSLLTASPLLLAEESHQHDQAAPTVTAAAPPADVKAAAAVGMPTGTPGNVAQQGTTSEPADDTDQGGGMTQMRSGRGIMGHGRGGKMDHGGGGMMGGGGDHGMGGHGMMKKHQEVLNRLDLLEARLAKIEVMLERLMQR